MRLRRDKGVGIKFGVLRHTSAGRLPTWTRNFLPTANFLPFFMMGFSLVGRNSSDSRDDYLVNDMCAVDEKKSHEAGKTIKSKSNFYRTSLPPEVIFYFSHLLYRFYK